MLSTLMKILLMWLPAFCWVCINTNAAAPLTGAFTYQGSLKQNSAPYTGTVNMVFGLYDTATTTTVIGTQTINSVVVTNGLFAVVLNSSDQFGANAFNGDRRWLGITVNGTTLTPRQEITAVPYAQGLRLPLSQTVSSFNEGLKIKNTGNNGVGILGESVSGYGVSAISESNNGLYAFTIGGFGVEAFSNNSHGVWASSNGADAIHGEGGAFAGVSGNSESGNGVAGSSSSSFGVNGISSSGAGVRGISTTGIGVLGSSSGTGFQIAGVYGLGAKLGIYGQCTNNVSGIGIHGFSNTGTAIRGERADPNGASNIGELGTVNSAVAGRSTNGRGVVGISSAIGFGTALAAIYGEAAGNHNAAVVGQCFGTNDGSAIMGIGTATGYAGYFSGRVYMSGACQIIGPLTKPGGSFKIDHPLDPANKYLSHSFVESPDMMNIYSGIVTTGGDGRAEVTLPGWFEALNKDFRYQLTVIDEADGEGFVQVKVVREIEGNTFAIRSSRPDTKVSWQVTGVRHDKWAEGHRIIVEENKPDAERGKYLDPIGYGKPESMGIERRSKIKLEK